MRNLILTCAILTTITVQAEEHNKTCMNVCQVRKDKSDIDMHFFYQSGALSDSTLKAYLNLNMYEYSGCIDGCIEETEAKGTK